MNRVLLGTLLGAFCARLALGFFTAAAQLPLSPIWAGIVVGLLTSAPHAIITKTYVLILGTGVLFGAVCGWAVGRWAVPAAQDLEEPRSCDATDHQRIPGVAAHRHLFSTAEQT